MKPIFERLADPALLEGCKHLYTQNANESLHHIVWGFAPKTQFNSAQECELALCLAVCQFNDGVEYTMTRLHEKLNLHVPASSVSTWQTIDSSRIDSAEYKNRPERKEKRKGLKRSKVHKDDAFKKVEGPTYKSNAFN